MKKILVLAEKPSVGRDIARVLGCSNDKNGYIEGPKYIVTWALGHLVTLADPESYGEKYKSWNIDDLPILPKYLKTVVIKKTSKQFNTVKAQMVRDDVSEIVVATDAGREGVRPHLSHRCRAIAAFIACGASSGRASGPSIY